MRIFIPLTVLNYVFKTFYMIRLAFFHDIKKLQKAYLRVAAYT